MTSVDLLSRLNHYKLTPSNTYSRLLALAVIFETWMFQDKSLLSVTPRSLKLSTISRGLPSIVGWSNPGSDFRNDIRNSLVFLTFNRILLVLLQSQTISISSWRVELHAGRETTSYVLRSSTYLYKGCVVVRSLIINRKNKGPGIVPWGTPALICFQLDLTSPSFTWNWRFCKKIGKPVYQYRWHIQIWKFH